MRTFLQDLRYGIRVGLSQPGFSLTIVLTLALAIGANTVIFSFTNILLLRPLPLHDQKTIAFISWWIRSVAEIAGWFRFPTCSTIDRR